MPRQQTAATAIATMNLSEVNRGGKFLAEVLNLLPVCALMTWCMAHPLRGHSQAQCLISVPYFLLGNISESDIGTTFKPLSIINKNGMIASLNNHYLRIPGSSLTSVGTQQDTACHASVGLTRVLR